jgi:DNA modification methylase
MTYTYSKSDKPTASTPVDAVEQLTFEPIKGYPMLNWRGKRPFTSTHFYPAQLKEVHGEEVDGWRNKIYWGDNLQVMSHLLKEFRGKVDLVYIDPPFDSKADYKKRIHLRGLIVENGTSAFEEKQYGDIWTNDEYLQFIFERLILVRELLKDTGTIFLHCDYHKSHLLRCILDEVFGPNNFINEIIWQKCNSKNFTSSSLSNVHDNIYLYSKDREYVFEEIFEDLSEEYIESAYRYTDSSGRKYRLLPLHAPGIRSGATGSQWNGMMPLPGNHWRFKPSTLDDMKSQGLIEISPTGVPSYRKYLDESAGTRIGTIWLDAKQLPGNEKKGYPTQKPESILDKAIRIGSRPGDIVFDCFMGSGTTQAVAMKLGRRFIGADINLGAIQTTTKRLIEVAVDIRASQTKHSSDGYAPTLGLNLDEDVYSSERPISGAANHLFYTGFEVYNVNNYDIFRNPVEARDLLIEALELERLPAGHLFDGTKDGRMWKIMPVNKIATRQDLYPLITGMRVQELADRLLENPSQPAEKITLVCMGHEPDLAATLNNEVALNLSMKAGAKTPLDVEALDILRNRSDLQFKRDSEASISVEGDTLTIEAFYPMNLLSKLSVEKEKVEDWREMVDSVMIDWNYDGAIFNPTELDIPEKNEMVKGAYSVPAGAGTIRVKITDVLSESLEVELRRG